MSAGMKPSYASTPATEKSNSGLRKVTGLFASDQGKGFEIRVDDVIKAGLDSVKVGDFIKVYQNESKSGKTYLSLNVKSLNK